MMDNKIEEKTLLQHNLERTESMVRRNMDDY